MGSANQAHRTASATSTRVISATPQLDSELQHDGTGMVAMQAVWMTARVLSPGNLVAWLGPAIRGMILQPLRDQYCELTVQERLARRESITSPGAELYCRDCHKNVRCMYGRVFEPDRLMIDGQVRKGQREGLRGITVAASFPVETAAKTGDKFHLRLLALGNVSESMIGVTGEALDAIGARQGLGADRVKFRLEPACFQEQSWELSSASLPMQVCRGTVPWLQIRLETPVFLKKSKPTRRIHPAGAGESTRQRISSRVFTKRPEDVPQLAGLVRESIRTVRRALFEYSDNGYVLEFDPRELLDAAEHVSCEHEEWQPFKQSRTSARQQSRWQPSGWYGGAIYRDVPLALIPWLIWGGRLGIGDSRNCGAGLWHVILA